MAYPPVIVVDKDDQEIGLEMLAEVWKKGLNHRMVRIMAEDNEGRILLQKRASGMTIFPDCWDNSAAGHVDEGMTYHRAAVQEVTEELGIPAPPLVEIGKYYDEFEIDSRHMNNFNMVYSLRVADTVILFEPQEVSEIKWVTKQELLQLTREHPDQCTRGLCQVAERYFGAANKERAQHVSTHRNSK
jgi:isopentenyldiphosphate isomerase